MADKMSLMHDLDLDPQTFISSDGSNESVRQSTLQYSFLKPMILQGIMVDVIEILGIKHSEQTWMAIGAYSSMGVFHRQSGTNE
jgi:hypothetical protein